MGGECANTRTFKGKLTKTTPVTRPFHDLVWHGQDSRGDHPGCESLAFTHPCIEGDGQLEKKRLYLIEILDCGDVRMVL